MAVSTTQDWNRSRPFIDNGREEDPGTIKLLARLRMTKSCPPPKEGRLSDRGTVVGDGVPDAWTRP